MNKDKYNIALLGGRGYVGQEIIKLLNDHPSFNLSMAYLLNQKYQINRVTPLWPHP